MHTNDQHSMGPLVPDVEAHADICWVWAKHLPPHPRVFWVQVWTLQNDPSLLWKPGAKLHKEVLAVLAVTPVFQTAPGSFLCLFTSLQDLLSALTNYKLPHTAARRTKEEQIHVHWDVWTWGHSVRACNCRLYQSLPQGSQTTPQGAKLKEEHGEVLFGHCLTPRRRNPKCTEQPEKGGRKPAPSLAVTVQSWVGFHAFWYAQSA